MYAAGRISVSDKPNIVFILIDDLGWRDIGCYGSSFYETPNLDRLALQGIQFTDAYASCPVCSPTRASLMTGKNPARVGITQWIGGHAVGKLCDVPYFYRLPESERTIATALKEGGYQTWHVGKWHLGEKASWPDKHGFEVNLGGCGWGRPMNGYISPWNCPTLEDGPAGEHLTDGLTDVAIRLIRQRDRNKPFYLNMCHYAVHTPLKAPEHLVEKYRLKAQRMGLKDADALVAGEMHPCQHKHNEPIIRRKFQSHAVYAAMVEHLDAAIGRLLDELDAQGLTDDTLVVFTSDNGGLATSEGAPTCNAPLSEGKGWMYEGGTRVCQLARWPGVIEPGRKCHEPCTSPDWYPTLLSAAGLPLEPQNHADGADLMPALRGENFERGPIFWHYPHYSNQGGTPAASIRHGDWKLIEFFEDHHLELYNLREDIGEKRNLAAAEPQRAGQLHKTLRAWQKEIEALFPKVNIHYQPQQPPPKAWVPVLDSQTDPAEI